MIVCVVNAARSHSVCCLCCNSLPPAAATAAVAADGACGCTRCSLHTVLVADWQATRCNDHLFVFVESPVFVSLSPSRRNWWKQHTALEKGVALCTPPFSRAKKARTWQILSYLVQITIEQTYLDHLHSFRSPIRSKHIRSPRSKRTPHTTLCPSEHLRQALSNHGCLSDHLGHTYPDHLCR